MEISPRDSPEVFLTETKFGATGFDAKASFGDVGGQLSRLLAAIQLILGRNADLYWYKY